MKVLQIMGGRDVGGAETAFADTVCALHKKGLKQQAVIREGAPCEANFRELGIPVTTLPFRKPFDWKTRPGIEKVIAAFQPDIVQTWMNRATQFCPKGNFVHVGWFGGYYKIPNYQNCDHLVGVTPDICRHQVMEGWPAEKAHVLRTFYLKEDAEPLDRREFETPEDVPLLLSLARLHPKKGLDVLLNALVKVPSAYLWIAGSGPLRDELESLAKNLKVNDRVRFLGWRTDRAALLEAADICVFPSRYEPFGTVMVEAWAHKVPLVAAASAGPKVHIKDGENGMLVPIEDADALAKAINTVIEDKDLADKIVGGGFKTYTSEFTAGKVVESYIDFYKSVLAAKSSLANS